MIAKGPFDVKTIPQPPVQGGGPFGLLVLDKHFHGALEGPSAGMMIAGGVTKGSGAYGALEQFSGTLDGRKGTFMLLHRGTMQGSSFQLDVTVVPDSGTEQLVGLAGAMKIIIEGKNHSYEFDYQLP